MDCLPSDCKVKGTVYITAAEAAQGFTISLMGWSGMVTNGVVTRSKEFYCTNGASPSWGSGISTSSNPVCVAAPLMAVRDKANTTVDSFIVTTNSAGKANTYSFSGVGGVINSASVYTPKSSGTLKTRSLSVDLTVDGQRYSSAGFLYVAAYYNGTLYVLTDKGWTTWDGVSAITAYQSVTLGKHTVSIANGSINLRGLDGLDVYVGYGRDAADMLSNKLYSKVHTLVTTAEDTAEIKAEQDLQIKYAALVEQYNREGLAFTFSYVTSSGGTAQCTASAAQSLQFGKFALANGYLVWQSPASCLFKSPYTVAYDESTKTWRVVQ